MTKSTFHIEGMTCGHCERSVRVEVMKLSAVTAAVASSDAGTLVLEHQDELDAAGVRAAVAEAGYRVVTP